MIRSVRNPLVYFFQSYRKPQWIDPGSKSSTCSISNPNVTLHVHPALHSSSPEVRGRQLYYRATQRHKLHNKLAIQFYYRFFHSLASVSFAYGRPRIGYSNPWSTVRLSADGMVSLAREPGYSAWRQEPHLSNSDRALWIFKERALFRTVDTKCGLNPCDALDALERCRSCDCTFSWMITLHDFDASVYRGIVKDRLVAETGHLVFFSLFLKYNCEWSIVTMAPSHQRERWFLRKKRLKACICVNL